MYPVVLVIDTNEERAQRVARLLCLADYRPMVFSTPYQAFDRALQEQGVPRAILLGQPALLQHHVFVRLLSHYKKKQKRDIPLLPLPTQVPVEAPLYAAPNARSLHSFAEPTIRFLQALDARTLISHRNTSRTPYSQIVNTLPAIGLEPRLTRTQRSRSNHFYQLLTSAYELIGEARWPQLINDVGLTQLQYVEKWPNDTNWTIPPEALSYLHQAVAFSNEVDPAQPLRQWGNNVSAALVRTLLPSLPTLKSAPPERVLRSLLTDFTEGMNEIRAEDLYEWRLRPDGTYWIIQYSNLFAYGRWPISPVSCHAWIAVFERILRAANLDLNWTVSEKECSCTTLTGHCLFVIQRR